MTKSEKTFRFAERSRKEAVLGSSCHQLYPMYPAHETRLKWKIFRKLFSIAGILASAPVAQLDRASGFELSRQTSQTPYCLLLADASGVKTTPQLGYLGYSDSLCMWHERGGV